MPHIGIQLQNGKPGDLDGEGFVEQVNEAICDLPDGRERRRSNAPKPLAPKGRGY
jgi:hypothetical protein